jgi:hypothetical protein
VRVFLDGGKEIEADLVVNATGPQTRFSATRSVLLQNLLQRGLVSSDDMDLGVRIDQSHTAITRDGERSPLLLLALGPRREACIGRPSPCRSSAVKPGASPKRSSDSPRRPSPSPP